MLTKKPVAFAAALMLITWSAQAQSLGKALDQAWARHPLIASSEFGRSAAQARSDVASALTPGPASLVLSAIDDQLGAKRGKQEWELEIETPLWLPGQRRAAHAEALANQSDFDAKQQVLRLQIAGEVREAWWAVAEARINYAQLVARNQTAQALAAEVERRVRAGEFARLDLNLANIEQISTQSELGDAKSKLLRAEQNFQLLTGEAPPQSMPSEALPDAQFSAVAHPQAQAAVAAKSLLKAKMALAQKSQREAPTLAIRMVRERSDLADSYANAFGVKLTIPFSMGARVRQDLDGNHALLVQVEVEYEQIVRRITLATEAGERLLKTSQLQLELASRRATLTQDNLTLLEKSFALGESDLPALLKARTAYFDAQAQLQRQQIEVHAAVSRFNQSLGVFP